MKAIHKQCRTARSVSVWFGARSLRRAAVINVNCRNVIEKQRFRSLTLIRHAAAAATVTAAPPGLPDLLPSPVVSRAFYHAVRPAVAASYAFRAPAYYYDGCCDGPHAAPHSLYLCLHRMSCARCRLDKTPCCCSARPPLTKAIVTAPSSACFFTPAGGRFIHLFHCSWKPDVRFELKTCTQEPKMSEIYGVWDFDLKFDAKQSLGCAKNS